MPVIIHDFEINVQPPEKKEGTAPAASDKPEASPALRPEDIARIEQFYRERRKRVYAD